MAQQHSQTQRVQTTTMDINIFSKFFSKVFFQSFFSKKVFFFKSFFFQKVYDIKMTV